MDLTFISDTHDRHYYMPKEEFKGGDLVCHGGDFSMGGSLRDLVSFLTWFDTLPYTRKVFIAGNHDWCFDRPEMKYDIINILARFPGVDYLENNSVTIDGIKIYGSPITPWFHDWAFNRKRGPEIDMEWQKIPSDTDILLTHGPPLNYGDKVFRGGHRVGCEDLLRKVEEVKPTLHMFGHIHEGYGMYTSASGVNMVNASLLNEFYQNVNDPVDLKYEDFL